MDNPRVSNPNDFKVVQFHNKTDFTFTPEMGCMFDGRPISGITGAPGINGGETMTLPYHIGHRLAINLAKVVMTRQAPNVDPAGIPTGVPLWDTVKLENLKNSYLTELYSESKPTAVSETDRLMAKVEEYKKMVEQVIGAQVGATPVPTPVAPVDAPSKAPELPGIPVKTDENSGNVAPDPVKVELPSTGYQDKQEVIAELEKRQIKHDKRKSKAELEKLLVPAAAPVA